MARGAAAVLLILGLATSGAAVGSSGSREPQRSPNTALTITYWQDESTPSTRRRWTLRCHPVGGTLPSRAVACRRLSRMAPAAFAPVPRNAICTEIYGGPQLAVVKGLLRGVGLWASFRRRNGCEIDRWGRFSPWLLPTSTLARYRGHPVPPPGFSLSREGARVGARPVTTLRRPSASEAPPGTAAA